MEKISESVKKFLDSQKLGYVATVSEDGSPNLSPKGTIISWDSTTLAFADIRSPNTMKNLEKNPNIEINVVDPLLRKGFRFKGLGRIIKNGPIYESILSHYRTSGIKSPIGAIVLVEISEVLEVTSPLYDLGFSEEQIKEKWKKKFLDL
ncbi:MAG: pyridoxamine 5'-phosphate oxidase family protein [Nitrosopumilus sp.]|nr:pyridoxamine 5'-phosphate oxidase family protein [Nitrosopumilus sp.]